MALSAIFEDVRTQFEALYPGATWHVGGEWLGAQEAAPRVVVVPTDDGYAPPEIHYDAATFPATSSARPLYQCDSTSMFHLWGKGFDDCEAMRDALVTALRASAAAAFKVTGGSWLTQDAAAIVQLGRVYVLTVSFQAPVIEIVPGTGIATITSSLEDVQTTSVP